MRTDVQDGELLYIDEILCDRDHELCSWNKELCIMNEKP